MPPEVLRRLPPSDRPTNVTIENITKVRGGGGRGSGLSAFFGIVLGWYALSQLYCRWNIDVIGVLLKLFNWFVAAGTAAGNLVKTGQFTTGQGFPTFGSSDLLAIMFIPLWIALIYIIIMYFGSRRS